MTETAGSLTWLATALVGASTLYWVHGVVKKHERRATLKRIAERAVEECHQTVQACLSHPADESAVYSVKETRDLVKRTTLNPAQNVLNLAKRCRKYGRGKVNAITEELYDDAYETALILDNNSAIDKASPLYGVAVSIKDCINQKGYYASAGLACRMHERSTNDALIVQVLKKAGAIPLCRGNVPQLLMAMESNNRVWGRTLNPWDLSRTPGGSTGGDAALVAMRCVPLACGSDVAGSCRIPASFCGVVGFKTTGLRLSLQGCMRPRKDNRNGTSMTIPTTAGPLARTVDGCAAFMKAVCVPELWNSDLSLPRLPFDNGEYTKTAPLKIGFFKTDEWFAPCAAARRGLEETIAALEKAGHTLVPFEPPANGWETNRILVGVNAADGNMRGYAEALEGEEFGDEYKFLYSIANMPNYVRFFAKLAIDKRRRSLLKCASKCLLFRCHDTWYFVQCLSNIASSMHRLWRAQCS